MNLKFVSISYRARGDEVDGGRPIRRRSCNPWKWVEEEDNGQSIDRLCGVPVIAMRGRCGVRYNNDLSYFKFFLVTCSSRFQETIHYPKLFYHSNYVTLFPCYLISFDHILTSTHLNLTSLTFKLIINYRYFRDLVWSSFFKVIKLLRFVYKVIYYWKFTDRHLNLC